MPIACFNKISETGDLRYLLKIDDYEYLPEYEGDLTKVWRDIKAEYLKCSTSKNKKAESILALDEAITRMRAKYYFLNTLFYLIAIDIEKRDKYLEELKEENIIIEYKTEGELLKKIEAERKKTGLISTKIKIKKKALERLTKKEGNIEFEDMLDILEQHKGYHIDIWKLSVKRWLALLKNFNIHQKRLKKQLEDGRRKNKKR